MNYFNTRLLYIPTVKNKISLSDTIEVIDNFLDSSLNMDSTSSDIFLYLLNQNEVFVGREVSGTDINLNENSILHLKDFRINNSEINTIEFNDFSDLFIKLSKAAYSSSDTIRIKLNSNNIFQAEIYSKCKVE